MSKAPASVVKKAPKKQKVKEYGTGYMMDYDVKLNDPRRVDWAEVDTRIKLKKHNAAYQGF